MRADSGSVSTRLATEAERRYLRRFNRLRLMRYLMFMTNFVFFTAIGCVFPWLTFQALQDGEIGMAISFLVMSLVVIALFFFWWRDVLPDFVRMRPWLRVPAEVKVSCIRDRLGALGHSTCSIETIFATGPRGEAVELPAHWAAELTVDGVLPDEIQPIEIAHLPGAWGKVLRLKMYSNPARRRIDPLLPDLGDFVLRVGDLSIDNEMRHRLPLLRASDSFALFGFCAGFVAAMVGLVAWIMLDDWRSDMIRQAGEIAAIEQEYRGRAEVPVAALAARGVKDLRPDPEFGTRLIRSAPVSFRLVAAPGLPAPFYITEDEMTVIVGMSTVPPWTLPGFGQPSAEVVDEYRGLLMARAKALEPIAPGLSDRIDALPEDLVATQLHTVSNSNAASRKFAGAFLPRPAIFSYADPSPYLVTVPPSCFSHDILCGQRDDLETYDAPAFFMQDGRIAMRSGVDYDLDWLAEARAELDRLQNGIWWPKLFWALCLFVFGLALIWVLAGYLARRKIRRWYRASSAAAPSLR